MDRLVGWFRSVVREMTQDLPYAGSYRYEVAGQDLDAQTLDLKPLGHDMPSLERVPMRVPGLKLDVSRGSDVVVSFANNDPTLPFIVAYSQQPAEVQVLNQITITKAQLATAQLVATAPGPTLYPVTMTLDGMKGDIDNDGPAI